MPKKLRKGTQLTLTNPKNAGRPAIHDRGIRHTKREEIRRPRPLHLTIKLNKAHIQNKSILKILKYAIQRGRLQGLRIIHFSLEHDHVHIYAETDSNAVLTKGMKALGVSFSKKINKFFKTKGKVYKTRFHLRVLKSASEVKNVINYILKNGMKHKRTRSFMDPYNSWVGLHDFRILGVNNIKYIQAHIQKYYQSNYEEHKFLLDQLSLYVKELGFVIAGKNLLV